MSNYENLSGQLGLRGSYIGNQDPRSSEMNHLRGDLEKEYSQRVFELKSMYEMRIHALQESIKNGLRLIQSDDLIDTMKQDIASEEFIFSRAKEIMEECVLGDKEALIEKLSHQYASLKGEFSKVENENLRLASQCREIVSDFNKKIDSIHEQYSSEVRNREYYENEVQNLRKTIQEMNLNFDDTLRKKDELLTRRYEKDNLDIQEMRDRIKHLEIELSSKEDQIWKITQENKTLFNDLDIQKNRGREIEMDLNSTRIDFQDHRNKLSQALKSISEHESLQKELKNTIVILNEENSRLRNDVKNLEASKSNLEETFQRKAKEIEKEINEQNNLHRDTLERVDNKNKEKIQQYKKKLLEYKNKISEKENQAIDLLKKIEEERALHEKNLEFVQLRLQEQRESYENKLLSQEEDNHKKLNELHVKHDNQLRELQNHFQILLDQRVNQIQDDANDQIVQLKNQERDLQILLEEKMIQLEKDYVKLSIHEDTVRDKQSLIEKLKFEISKRESEYRQELTNKLKNLEDRLTDDFNYAQKGLKNTISELESSISRSEQTIKRLETDLKNESEQRKILNNTIQDLEGQKKKLNENLEDLSNKNKKLKNLYEENEARMQDLESFLKEQQDKSRETSKLLEQANLELEEKSENIRNLFKQIESSEANLAALNKNHRTLQRDLEEFKNEALNIEQQKNETIKLHKETIDGLRQEIKSLNEKIIETIKSEKEKLDSELTSHFETKNLLKAQENKITLSILENENLNQQIEKLKKAILELEDEKNDIKNKLLSSENNNRQIIKEKSDLNRKLENAFNSFNLIKKNINLFILSKLNNLKSDLRDMKTYFGTSINNLLREQEYKYGDITYQLRLVIERKATKFENEKESLQIKLKKEFQSDLDGLTDKYERLQKELTYSNEQKLSDKDKKIQICHQDIESLNRKLANADAENDRLSRSILQAEEEVSRVKIQLTSSIKEKENSVLRLDQSKSHFAQEIDDLRQELRKASDHFMNEKRQLELHHSAELGELQEQIESLKNKQIENLRKYEVQVNELSRAHHYEMEDIKKHYEDLISHLKRSLTNTESSENELGYKNSKLQDRVIQLEREIQQLELDKGNMQAQYEARLEDFETKMEEVNYNIQQENARLEDYQQQKQQEISQLQGNIQVLQEEIKIKTERINTLVAERTRFQQHIKDLQSQIDLKASEMDKQRQEIVEKTLQQTKEIEHLHSLLSKSYRAPEEDILKSRDENDPSFSKTVEDLKRLNHYLESTRSPSKSGYTQRDRSPFSASYRGGNNSEFETFRSKRNLNQFKP